MRKKRPSPQGYPQYVSGGKGKAQPHSSSPANNNNNNKNEIDGKEKSFTIRVDNIPNDVDADALSRHLQAIVARDLGLLYGTRDLRVRSLVAREVTTNCATVSLKSSVPADEFCLRLGNSDSQYHYTYTSRFEGITPLHADQAVADLE
ncbi:hypothetical protein ACHAQH_004872 [Verticillium albo-atrum]